MPKPDEILAVTNLYKITCSSCGGVDMGILKWPSKDNEEFLCCMDCDMVYKVEHLNEK